MYISTPPSPKIENFQIKMNPGPAEPEADVLPSEPTWRALLVSNNDITIVNNYGVKQTFSSDTCD